MSDFHSVTPRFLTDQDTGNRWLAEAHVQAELTRSRHEGTHANPEALRGEFTRMVDRYGCSSKSIGQRGHELDDFLHTDWEKMRVFSLHETAEGASIEKRMLFYDDSVRRAFREWYPKEPSHWNLLKRDKTNIDPPKNLIHVTCTGYRSPSPAQEICSSHRWLDTHVTHLYHMGCYAAIPALRLASGFLRASPGRVDIAHTELCSLHLNPLLHTPEQFIVQSLFADGMIRYNACVRAKPQTKCFQVLNIRERLIPDSSPMMTWVLNPWGMQMSLSKEVPVKVALHIKGFLNDLFDEAGLSYSQEKSTAICAIHPGGPRILEQVQDFLHLRDEQVGYSRKVLKERGNMSSATLPHIWSEILACDKTKNDDLVVSVAFGPGLTMAGALLRLIEVP